MYSFLGIDEETYRNLPTFDQNVRTVYSNIRTAYPSKNHVTTHPEVTDYTNLAPQNVVDGQTDGENV